MPLLMAVCVMAGILIGTLFANRCSGNRLNIVNNGGNRINNLLHIIDDQYVDKVNIDSLVEKAMPQILAELDPHSVYISAKEVQMATDDLKGSFFGVGIEFVIRNDTLHVQGVIANGPAEKAGVIAGDKIISVDDKPFVGGEQRGGNETPERKERHKSENRCEEVWRQKNKVLHYHSR